ncbi:type II toxin-antitoxin system HicA family toxin, partial [Vibrio parahaemolyticus]|nr:type II toxin-antitoxin system HicA family toxin [Vibrio parahaemolyticus]
CEFVRHGKGSHQIWRSPITGKKFPVPHPKGSLPIGTVRSIKKRRGHLARALGGNDVVYIGCRNTKR